MKKFTRLWQLMMVLLLSSTVAFAQVDNTGSAKNAEKQNNDLEKIMIEKTLKYGQFQQGTSPDAQEIEYIQEKVQMNEEGDTKVVTAEVDPGGTTMMMPTATAPQQSTKVPKWNMLKAPEGGGPTDDLFCPTSTYANIFSEDANGYSSASTCDTNAGYRAYQGYTGNFTINEIHFWYIHAYFDGVGWGACALGDEEPVSVEIGFYQDNGGVPGTQVGLYDYESVTGVPTGELFAGAYEIYEYTYTVPGGVTITDGWVSLMGSPSGDDTCWFMWVNSSDVSGANDGWQEELGVGGSTLGYPMSLCIYGTNNMVNNVGVTSVDSPQSGTGLGAAELVSITIHNTGSADQTVDFPVSYTYGATVITEMYDAVGDPIPSGETRTHDFTTTFDASAVGPYTITACTELVGDELAADDCMIHNFAHYAPYDCTWEIIGYDDYGDTWNGGYIEIYLDGDLHHVWTGPLTSGPDSFFFGIYDPCTIDIVWVPGGWAYEASYYVYDNYSVERGNDGLNGVDPTGIVGLAGDCNPVTCPPPTAQTATNITFTSADLGWTEAGTATQWEVEIVPTGVPPSGSGTVTVMNPYTATGLTPCTTYDWYVQAECSPFDQSTWTGPHTFTTACETSNMLAQYAVEGITGDIRGLGAHWFNERLWVTGANDGTGTANQIYEIQIDFTSDKGTLVSTIPQGTTTTWGMRDLCDDGSQMYSSDENGFYNINAGVVGTVFTSAAPIFGVVSPLRALAYDGTNFWTKSFAGDLYSFDIAGNIVAGPFALTESTYGMAFDGTNLWLHNTGGVTGNQMSEVTLAGVLTGNTMPVPMHDCGPIAGSVGGSFYSEDIYTGFKVFGTFDQTDPDVVKIWEVVDLAQPGQAFGHMPVCGTAGVSVAPTVTWNFGDDGPVSYRLEYGPAGVYPLPNFMEDLVPGPIGSHTLTGLAGATEYEWRVNQTNGTGTMPGLYYSFTTECGIIYAPYLEEFTVWPPVCWDLTGGTYSWIQYALDPVYCAEAGFWGQTAGNTNVMTIEVNTSMLSNPAFWFDWSHLYNATYPLDQMDVNVSDDGGGTWFNEWSLVGAAFDSGDGATSTAPGSFVHSGYFDLSGYGPDVLIQFYATSGYGPDVFVDNVVVDEMPQCFPPSAGGATNITSSQADLFWTDNVPGGALSFDLEHGTAGFTPSGIPTHVGVSNPYTMMGLAAQTSYDFYVIAYCATGPSTWAGPYTYTTSCDAVVAPVCEPFAATTIPVCWSEYGDEAWIFSTGAAYDAALAGDHTTGGGTNYAWIDGSGAGTSVATLESGPVDVSGLTNGYLSFWIFSNNTSYPTSGNNTINVEFFDGDSWEPVAGFPYSGNSPVWMETLIDLSTYTIVGDVAVRFIVDENTAATSYHNDMLVDDVCFIDLMADDVGTISIDINGFYATPGTIIPMATVKNFGSNPQTFDVTMAITDGYSSNATVTLLPGGDTEVVTFAPWTQTVGDWSVTVCTQLVGDMDPTNDCMTETVFVRDLDKQVYGYNAYANLGTMPIGPLTFNLNAPGVMISLEDQSALGDDVFSGTWANGFWWAQAVTSFDLVNFDPEDGERSTVGPTGLAAALNGLAYDVTNGILYGIDATNLYTVDMNLGTATAIAAVDPVLAAALPVNLACYAGVLYSAGLDDNLYIVDVSGAATLVGPLGVDINYAQDMEFDQETGDLYMAAYNNTVGMGELRWVDLTSGASYLIGQFDGGLEMCGFAIPYGNMLYGNVSYVDPPTDVLTPMDNTPVTIEAGGIMRTAMTDCDGDYSFNGLDGTYNMSATSTKPTGGLTMNDVQYARQYVTLTEPGLSLLVGLYNAAGDVSLDGNLFMNDVQAMWQQVTFNPPGFTSFWIFEEPTVAVAGSDVMQDLGAIAAGDTDGSYAPPGSCPDPTGLAVAGVGSSSADITWMSGSGESDIFWGPTGVVPPTGGTLVFTVTSPYSITGLMQGSTYDVYVRDVCCTGASTSEWVGPLTFTTVGPGATCADPYIITDGDLPFVQTGMTTEGYGDDYDYTTHPGMCYYYGNGEDFIFEYTPSADITVDIALTNTDTWTGINVSLGCPDVGTCVGYAGASAGNPVYAGLDLLAGNTYYILIGTWPTPDFTPFDISITQSVAALCTVGVGPTSTIDSNVELVDITGDGVTAINYIGCPGVAGVEDLTGILSVDVTVGNTYTLDVTFGTCGGSYAGAGEAWINWNDDFDFEAGESLGTWAGTPITPPNVPTSFTFTVPATAVPGTTVRMRVMQWEGGANPLDPCGSFTYGSVMDFDVNVN